MPNLTQRQAALGVLGLMLAVGVVMFFYYGVNSALNPTLLLASAVGSGLLGLILLAYWRGWEYARHTTVIVVTLIEALAIPDPRSATYVPHGVFLPPVLALVLTGPRGVLGSAVTLWVILMMRAGGQGIYTSFSAWVIYGACVAGLVVARLVTETAQRAAEASAQAAHAQAAELQRQTESTRQAEDDRRALIENIQDSIWSVDQHYRVITFNSFFAEQFHLTFGIQLQRGQLLRELLSPKLAAEWKHWYDRALAGEKLRVEQRYRMEGQAQDFLVSLHPIYSGETIAGVAVHSQNITERKQAEAAWRADQANLTALIENTSDSIWSVDRNYGLIISNSAFGQVQQAFLGHTIDSGASVLDEGFVPELRAAWQACYDRALNGERFTDEMPLPLPHGTLYLENSFNPIYSARGAITGVSVLSRNVTERKQAEAALREAERSYRDIFENTLEGIYRSSLDGRMLRANPALVRLNGYTTEAELLAAVNDIATEWYVAPQRRAEFRQVLDTHGQVTHFESEIYRHKTRERIWISETARLVRNAAGQPVWYEGTVQDITERELARQALARKVTQLTTLAEVSAAAATILNPHTLLTVIVNLTKEKFDLYHAQIYVVEAQADVLTLAAGAGAIGEAMLQEGWHIPLSHAHSLVARAAQVRASTIVNDVQREPDFLPNARLPLTRAELVVPMLIGPQLLGVFDLQSDTSNRFTADDLLVYTALARQLAVALENARRYTLAQTEIAERQRAEQALRESEEKFRLLAENLPGAVYLCRNDANYTALYVNDAIEAVTGYPPEEFLSGRVTLSDIDHPDDHAYLHAETDQALRARRPFHLTYRIRHASGEWRWLEEVGVGVYRDDKVLYLEGFIHDITERQRVEEALRQSEERYRFVTEGLAHFIFVVQAGMVEYMNAHWTAYTGQPASASLRRGWIKAQHPDDYDRIVNDWRAAMHLGERSEVEHRVQRADGQYRWHRTILQPVRDEASAAVKWIGLTVDIHDQREAEAQIRQMNETLEERVRERTAQLEAANHELESFTYSVSHDLRAPLRAMDGFSRLLLHEYAAHLPDEAQAHLQRIRSGAQRMGALIDDLLAFSHLGRQALNKQPVRMMPLVRQVWDELTGDAAGYPVELVINDLPDSYADPGLLKQVWANLLENARKFTRQAASARIEVGYELHPLGVIYFVRDNGAGFDMRYADKLFGVFQRLHAMEDYEGTGVGLAIVHRIIQRHGGRVWAEAEEGRGATFYFTLT